MTKPSTAFRIDKHLLTEAKKAGINVRKVIEASLAKMLKEKKCPYCGNFESKKYKGK